jgi:hypothetical protein
MAAKKKGGGGKLSRSEIVTVRLDPKLRFAAELAARKQRRTLSSFIEWAIDEATDRIEVTPPTSGHPGFTVLDALERIWDVEEADRMVNLALMYPQLLTFEEEKVWKLVCECQHFWVGGVVPDMYATAINHVKSQLCKDRLRNQWENLHKIIEGELSVEYLQELDVDPF